MRRAALLAFTMIASGNAKASEQIGSWTLTCPSAEPCRLHLTKRFLEKAAVTGDFEVQASGENLVPVIALRGLPPQVLLAATMAGDAQASIQLNNTAREDLMCSYTTTIILCVPRDSHARALATALPTAHAATVRVSVTIAGMPPLPEQEKSLDLSGTAEALARFRTAGPTSVPALSVAGGITAMAAKLLKAAGYPNGLADLEALLAKYRGK